MVSSTSWDLILKVWEVLRVHFHDSWRYLRLLEISMNFKVFSETPRILRPLPGEGKRTHSRAHYYRQLGGYRRQNVTYSMEHGTWRLKGITNCRLNHIPHSLMAPGKQRPADIKYV